jgi:hypothetical protein
LRRVQKDIDEEQVEETLREDAGWRTEWGLLSGGVRS